MDWSPWLTTQIRTHTVCLASGEWTGKKILGKRNCSCTGCLMVGWLPDIFFIVEVQFLRSSCKHVVSRMWRANIPNSVRISQKEDAQETFLHYAKFLSPHACFRDLQQWLKDRTGDLFSLWLIDYKSFSFCRGTLKSRACDMRGF